MNRFNVAPHAPSAANAGSFHPGLKTDRHDQGSPPSSDDGYSNYDAQKAEADLEDDSNALTSQTLNADGTPKRPMNAFMIFARRRRPQVSSENQSMRTGEISKILSKEWNSMQPPDKQFYLDQAKQLKETFNTKYPDYVYRRRPNNSRKRRRTDGISNRSGDTPLQSDAGDDLADLGEPSPTDGEEDRAADVPYSRLPSDSSQSYNDNFISSQSRTSSYPYPSYRHNGPHENRLPYAPGHESISHDVSSTTSLTPSSRLSQPTQPSLNYTYLPPQSHTQSSALYGAEQNDGRGNWEPRAGHGRAAAPGWVAGNHERSVPLLAVPKPPSYSPNSSQNGTWPNTASSASVSPVSNSGSHSANFPFPTLNTPFYPTQTQMQGNYSNPPSSTSSHSNSPSQYNPPPGHMQGTPVAGRHGSGYDHRGYVPSSSDSLANTYPPSSNRNAHLYQPSRHSGQPRGLSSVQSISNSSHSQSLQSPSSSASQIGYWPREKSDG